jgi:hypothetical protein
MSDRRRDRLKAWVQTKLRPVTPVDLPNTPTTPSTTPVTTPPASTPHRSGAPPWALSVSKSAVVVDNLTVTLALVQQVAKIGQQVPWIAPAAALMSEILNIYKVCSNDCLPHFLINCRLLGSKGYKRETGISSCRY